MKRQPVQNTILPIQCQEIDRDSMDCKWVDDNDQEHTLSYSKESEYIYFDQEFRQWRVLHKEVISPPDEDMDEPGDSRALIARDVAPQPVRAVLPCVCEFDPPGSTKKACEWHDDNGLLRTFRFDSETHYEHFNKFDRKWIVLKKNLKP
jgi:hypothetical protein